MKCTLMLIRRSALIATAIAAASLSAPAQTSTGLNGLTAGAIVDMKAVATAVAGEFSPASAIDPTKETVVLTIDGTAITIPPEAFKKTAIGGYIALPSATPKTGITFQPLRHGRWAYSSAAHDVAPNKNSFPVSLSIGNDSGNTTARAFVFPKQ